MLDAKRIRSLIEEARADLRRYDALRANTNALIATYEKRLELLGDETVLPLPGVELTVKNKPTSRNGGAPSNKDRFEAVLREASGPLDKKQVWERAQAMGARTDSSNPYRMTDSVLREMVTQGRLVLVRPGRFTVKRETQVVTS